MIQLNAQQTITKTILVIEDERVTRTSLLNFLRDEGFRAIGAENGFVGVQQATEQRPDLIICDITMPELNGYDVLTTLQQNPLTAKIPFIFLTKSATVKGRHKSLALGADDYLAKPVSSHDLRQAIAAQLEEPARSPSNSQTSNLQSIPQSDLKPDLQSELGCTDLFSRNDSSDLSDLSDHPVSSPGLPHSLALTSAEIFTANVPTWAQQFADSPADEVTDLLLERFCQVLQQKLSSVQRQLEQIQASLHKVAPIEQPMADAKTDPIADPIAATLAQVQQELSQLLTLTHEVAVHQSMINSDATLDATPDAMDNYRWDQPLG
jgi:CheY-like chemotaxis protein